MRTPAAHTRLTTILPPTRPRRPRPARAFLALLLPLAACGDGGGAVGGGVEVVVDTVGGVERLRYGAEGGVPLEWSVDTLFVLGDAFAEEEYQFNEVQPSGLAADGNGGMLVLDGQGKRVLRYGPDGRHTATYGREGGGPGEFGQPMGLALGPGDTVWVSDFSNTRLTGYPLEGGAPRSLSFPGNAGFPNPRMAALEEGFLLHFRPMFDFRRMTGGGGDGGGDGGDERAMLSLIRYDRESFESRDTLWRTPEAPTDMVQLEAGGRVMVMMMAREFHPAFRWAPFSDGGLVVADSAAYLLHLVDPDGRVRRRVARDPSPRAVTEADREAARERIREQSRESGGILSGGGGPDETMRQRMLEERLSKMTFADVLPRIVGLGVDALDRIWVGIREDGMDGVARIDLYDRDGTLIGHLRDFPMPDAFLEDGRVALLRRDDLDVQQVVVLQVREGQAEGAGP
jgi:hypothetical protein